MNGFVGTAKIAATAIALSAAIFVTGAQAQSNCEAYMRLTLQQVKEAAAKRCGFKGPRWSLNASAHKQWCQDVGPDEWRKELKTRSDELAKCKG